MSNLNPGGLTRVLNYIKTWVTGLLNDKANSSHSHTKSQITDFPTIPTVNNATLTIQKNGTTVNSFTANASSNVTANITVPTKTSDLTNDSGYITSTGSCSYSTTSGTSTYSTYLNSLGAQTPKSGRDIFHSGVYTYTTYTDTNTPAHYGAVIGYGNGQGGSCEMFAEWVGKGNLWFRVLRDCDDSWTNWQRIITSDNIGSQSVNYANSAGSVAWGNVSGRPSLATVATSGSYTDLSNKPTIPSNNNQLTNGAGYITSSGSCNYANSAGYATTSAKLIGDDTRNNNYTPANYITTGQRATIRSEFKQRSTLGAPGDSTYGTSVTITPWSDNSGGRSVQLYFSDNGYTSAIRFATGDSSWSSWYQLNTEYLTKLNGYRIYVG